MGYSKAETIRKRKNLVSGTPRVGRKILVNFFKIFLVFLVALVIAGAGVGFGMIKGILDNAPSIDDVHIVPKGYRTTIYDADGNEEMIVANYDSNRVYTYYEDIPKNLINAFVAIEDERFWQHNGIDVRGIFRAFRHGIMGGSFDQGASTITQQLIKNEVFNVGMGEKTFLDSLERKIQEQALAIELEKKYSKEEIIEVYLNTIYLGGGAYGVFAAADTWFDKELKDLTLAECAVIAGITQNPSLYNPVNNPEGVGNRREDVLDKMLELGYITQAEYTQAMNDDVFGRVKALHEKVKAEGNVNTYYEDAILDQLEDDFMELYGVERSEAQRMIFSGGYSVYSVQDKKIQAIADDVINHTDDYFGIDRVGLSYDLILLDKDKEDTIYYSTYALIDYFAEKTENPKFDNIFDSKEDALVAIDEFKQAMLEETGGSYVEEHVVITPQPQFAFTLMDHKTGYVKAMVGGRGEKKESRSWNRTFSARQPGSTFKVLAAYLPFFDLGMGGLATPIEDAPFNYYNGTPVSNWYGGYRGFQTCRMGIQNSMNVLAVKVITMVDPQVAFEYLKKLHLSTLVEYEVGSDGTAYSDANQSTALGGLTYGVTTHDMTAAYGAIANMGVYTKPVLYSKVVDHDGKIIIDNTKPQTERVMKATTAWQLIDGMKSVLTAGTGGPAKMWTGIQCAGKTGTTSSDYDLWFCGMTPYYTASIWMGYDSNRSMPYYGTVHEEVWRVIMDRIAEMEGQDPSLDWEVPDGITTVTLCKETGKLPGEGCLTVTDYFAADAIPTGRCPGHQVYEYCEESHLLANKSCPKKLKFRITVDEKTGEKKLVGEDGKENPDFKITEEHCNIHKDEKVHVNTRHSKGGTISDSIEVDKGSNVKLYITPDAGYAIKDVLVDGESRGAVTELELTDIQKDVKVIAQFKKISSDDPTTEKQTTEKQTTEKQTTEKQTTEKQTTEKQTTEKDTTEEPPTEEPPTEEPPTEEPPTEEPPTEEPPTEEIPSEEGGE